MRRSALFGRKKCLHSVAVRPRRAQTACAFPAKKVGEVARKEVAILLKAYEDRKEETNRIIIGEDSAVLYGGTSKN